MRKPPIGRQSASCARCGNGVPASEKLIQAISVTQELGRSAHVVCSRLETQGVQTTPPLSFHSEPPKSKVPREARLNLTALTAPP